MKSHIRSTLNQIIWYDSSNIADYEIFFLHRGAPCDVRRISASEITGVFRGCFSFKDSDGTEKTIPYHRVLLIKNRVKGEVLFEKRP
ncbi:MAG: RNA repair domain-containing protein [Candidatus Nezhaarchaeota archaeon]|nr:RNA repair domain-containing protein [Candidatus Nezhaarchaeota archaeon]